MIWRARKAIQWWLHGRADWVMCNWILPTPVNSRRGALAVRVSNALDRLAGWIGGHTW
jgi:hypothetical protein